MTPKANSMPVTNPIRDAAPFHEGYVQLTGLHTMYFAEYGLPDGPAAVVVHGGPGSASNSGMLRWFDLATQRVVLFDQRGAGRSLPSGSLNDNDTTALIMDMERLRHHLRIGQWMVVGGSWGGLLAILYTARFEQHVSSLILRGIFLGSDAEMIWFFQSLRALIPRAWGQLTHGWDEAQKQQVLQNLTKLLHNGTVAQQQDAAVRWNEYENQIMAAMLGIHENPVQSVVSMQIVLNKYRIQSHYLSQQCFISQHEIEEAAHRIRTVPVIIVHGTHDWICPPTNALRLQAWIGHAQLRWVARAGHTPQDPALLAALQQAIADSGKS